MSLDVPPTNQLSSHERGRINPKCRLDVERCCRPSLVEKVKFEIEIEIEIEKKLVLKCEEKIGSHIKKSRNKTYYVYKSKNNRAKRCGSHRDNRPLKKLPNTETVTKGGCCSPQSLRISLYDRNCATTIAKGSYKCVMRFWDSEAAQRYRLHNYSGRQWVGCWFQS